MWLSAEPSLSQRESWKPSCTTVRLTSNGNRPFAEDEGGKGRGSEVTYKMIESLRTSMSKDSVKASMSMGNVRKRAFNDRARVDPAVQESVPEMGGLGQQCAHFHRL